MEESLYGPFDLDQMMHLPREGEIMRGPDNKYFGIVQSLSWFWEDGFHLPPTKVVVYTTTRGYHDVPVQEEDYEPDWELD